MFGEWEDQDDPEILKETEKLTKKILELEKQRKELSMDKLKGDREIASLHGDSMAQLEAEFAMAKKVADFKAEAFERMKGLNKEEKEILEGQIDAQEKLIEGITKAGETAEEAVERLRGATTGMAKEGSDAGQAFFGGIASKLGMASRAGDTWIGKLQTMSVKMKDPSYAENFAGKMREIFTLQNMVGSAITMVAQATMALILATDKAAASFSKSTGTGKTHHDMLYEVGGSYRAWGITTEDTEKSMQSLFKNLPGWTDMSEAQGKALLVTTAKMEKLGVATDDTATLMNDLMKSQGLSAEMAQKQATDLAMEAESLQMSAGEYVKGFNQANKTLAVYGTKAPRIFRNITIAAQKAGVETGKLLDLAGKFDTFSDSAETAGKLNAILGTQFSATKMLRMEEDERIESVIRGIQASGRQFKDMDRFTQKAVAQSLGISDLNEARKILGSDVSGYRKMQKRAEQAAKAEEDMKEKAQAAMTAQQKLTMAFMEFAQVIKPAFHAFQDFAQAVLEFSEKNKGLVKFVLVLGGGLLAIAKVFTVLKTIAGPLFALFGMTGAPAITAVGEASTVAAPGTISFAAGLGGISLASIGLGIALGIVILAFTHMVVEISKINEVGPGVIQFMIGAAIAVGTLAFALGTMGTVGIIGAVILGTLIAEMIWFMKCVDSAATSVGGAFVQVNSFLSKEGELSRMAKALRALGAAFADMNNSMKGGTISKGLNMIGLGSIIPAGKSPIAQMADDMMPLIDNADSLAALFTSLAEVINADIGTVFSDIATSVNSLYESLRTIAQGPVEIKHTLENLALVSAGTASRNSGIVEAIKSIGGQREMTVRIEIKDKEALKKIIEDGYVEARGKVEQ